MAEIEERERTVKEWAKIIVPRVARAAAWGLIMGGEMLILMMFPGVGEQFTAFLPAKIMGFSNFLLVFIAIEVAIQLLRGTIFPYALSIARALISMFMLVLMTNGGVLTIAIQSSSEISIAFTIEFQTVLVIFLLLSLVSLIKNLLQAIEFLSEKTEEPMIPPELP
jgi:hypothetical protein